MDTHESGVGTPPFRRMWPCTYNKQYGPLPAPRLLHFLSPKSPGERRRTLVRCSFVRTNIVYTDLRIRSTPRVSRFRVGFVLDPTITSRWTCKTKPTKLNKKPCSKHSERNRNQSLRNRLRVSIICFTILIIYYSEPALVERRGESLEIYKAFKNPNFVE